MQSIIIDAGPLIAYIRILLGDSASGFAGPFRHPVSFGAQGCHLPLAREGNTLRIKTFSIAFFLNLFPSLNQGKVDAKQTEGSGEGRLLFEFATQYLWVMDSLVRAGNTLRKKAFNKISINIFEFDLNLFPALTKGRWRPKGDGRVRRSRWQSCIRKTWI